MTHQVRSVTMNLRHVWECRVCGRRWNPDVPCEVIEAQRCEDQRG